MVLTFDERFSYARALSKLSIWNSPCKKRAINHSHFEKNLLKTDNVEIQYRGRLLSVKTNPIGRSNTKTERSYRKVYRQRGDWAPKRYMKCFENSKSESVKRRETEKLLRKRKRSPREESKRSLELRNIANDEDDEAAYTKEEYQKELDDLYDWRIRFERSERYGSTNYWSGFRGYNSDDYWSDFGGYDSDGAEFGGSSEFDW